MDDETALYNARFHIAFATALMIACRTSPCRQSILDVTQCGNALNLSLFSEQRKVGNQAGTPSTSRRKHAEFTQKLLRSESWVCKNVRLEHELWPCSSG